MKVKNLILFIIALSLAKADDGDDDAQICDPSIKSQWYSTNMPYCEKDTLTVISYDCNLKNI
jgi:hypothetical protein